MNVSNTIYFKIRFFLSYLYNILIKIVFGKKLGGGRPVRPPLNPPLVTISRSWLYVLVVMTTESGSPLRSLSVSPSAWWLHCILHALRNRFSCTPQCRDEWVHCYWRPYLSRSGRKRPWILRSGVQQFNDLCWNLHWECDASSTDLKMIVYWGMGETWNQRLCSMVEFLIFTDVMDLNSPCGSYLSLWAQEHWKASWILHSWAQLFLNLRLGMRCFFIELNVIVYGGMGLISMKDCAASSMV